MMDARLFPDSLGVTALATSTGQARSPILNNPIKEIERLRIQSSGVQQSGLFCCSKKFIKRIINVIDSQAAICWDTEERSDPCSGRGGRGVSHLTGLRKGGF